MFQRFTHSIASCPFQTGDSFPRWTCNLGSFYCHDCNWSPKSRGLREWWAIYLVVTGSFVLGFPFLAGLGFACAPPIGAFLGGVGLIAKLAIQIWGSITVFGESYWIHKFSHEWLTISFLGSYADWTSDVANAGQGNFCPETPFMFSFVWLIIVWSLIPLACCLAACGLAGWEKWRKLTMQSNQYIWIWKKEPKIKVNSNEKCNSCICFRGAAYGMYFLRLALIFIKNRKNHKGNLKLFIEINWTLFLECQSKQVF